MVAITFARIQTPWNCRPHFLNTWRIELPRRERNRLQVTGVRLVLVLAIETTGLSGSVALADDSNLLAERTLTEGQRSAQSLIPSIDQLLRGAGRQVADIGLIGVAI